MKIGMRLDLAPGIRVAQVCSICGQEIVEQRKRPLNVILIEGYDMCPACHQEVALELQTQAYRIAWHQFTIDLELDR